MSIKQDLIGEQFVKGNLKEALQVYKIFYYPPEVEHPSSKVWLYFNRKEGESYFGIKSLCFSNMENHINFIVNNLFYHLYWLEQLSLDFKPDWITINNWRMELLNRILSDLRKK